MDSAGSSHGFCWELPWILLGAPMDSAGSSHGFRWELPWLGGGSSQGVLGYTQLYVLGCTQQARWELPLKTNGSTHTYSKHSKWARKSVKMHFSLPCRASVTRDNTGSSQRTLAAGSSSSTLSNIDPGEPVYSMNIASFCNTSPKSLYWADLPVFQSDLRLMPWSINLQNPENSGLSTLGNYPFDHTESASLSACEALRDFSLSLDRHSFNLRPSGNSLMESFIAAVSVIFFGMIVDIYLWGYNRRIEVLVLPIATLFAFTQLRQTLPGVPATGTVLDYYVNLPCFFLLALSVIQAALAVAVLISFTECTSGAPDGLDDGDRGAASDMASTKRKAVDNFLMARGWQQHFSACEMFKPSSVRIDSMKNGKASVRTESNRKMNPKEIGERNQ
ncbi:hypothetical protein C8R45DRAFT_937264 [Mycena sanguinolenta]|nr:hypothetical protein C8R45DRAFT_937264 [Mycena sanguinolenta]